MFSRGLTPSYDPPHHGASNDRGTATGAAVPLFANRLAARYSKPTLCIICRIWAGSGSIMVGTNAALAVGAGPRAR